VDISSYKIVGSYCLSIGDTDIIWELADSTNMWENRIAIVSSWAFIKANSFTLTLNLCEHFLNHEHHLIHKACGWMLREISKRDPFIVIEFINDHKVSSITKSYALEIIRKMKKSKI
jgi:3-methyladenine DNA glycosylase AlkD